MSRDVMFPERRSWWDLFDVTTTYDGKSGLGVRIRGSSITVGPYCVIDGQAARESHRSLAVRLRADVMAHVVGSLIDVTNDRLHFNVVVRNADEALVVLSYGQILGSRWLAFIDPATIPGEVAP